ncbi:MAG: proton-translocating transhydrogenase family protein [Hydrotalea sp.]|nr:proton-translocating transhydrogenase family protein [Hydrotalea sp.]
MTHYSYMLAGAALSGGGGFSHFFVLLMAFVLACFIGYFVVWSVTPALHSPLMGVTNAISSVIIVGAILALVGGDDGAFELSPNKLFGSAAVVLAAVNIVGGFLVTQRMLAMFQKKKIVAKKTSAKKRGKKK